MQLLAFEPAEGDAVLIDINGNTLVAASSKAVIRLWDLARREARSLVVCVVCVCV